MTDAPVDNTPAETPEGQPPAEASKAPAKKAPAKKAAAKKATAKKTAAKKAPAKKAAAKKAAAPTAGDPVVDPEAKPAKKAAAKKTTAKKAPAKKAAAKKAAVAEPDAEPSEAPGGESAPALLFQAPEPTRRRTRKAAAPKADATADSTEEKPAEAASEDAEKPAKKAAQRKPAAKKADKPAKPDAPEEAEKASTEGESDDNDDNGNGNDDNGESSGAPRRRRRRGGRRRRKSGGGSSEGGENGNDDAEASDDADGSDQDGNGPDQDGEKSSSSSSSRRRRRRRREGEGGSDDGDDPNTVTKVRKARSPEDEITSLSGSTRLEAKKQRRREGREAGRRRAPIVSEAEFLARRESVERVMVIRQKPDLTQIGVLEDKVLVEHYVARESQTSLIGNVYLGRVQNVLPSMEAAFIDIGKGRNAVLYAGEVNWSALGWKEGTPRKIESVLSSGQTVLVQVTKDPIGHKGARLTSQVSLAGRFLVYVPDGTTSGISRKLPDTERSRLKSLLKEIVPDTAGVIVRTAAEGAAEDELTRDVERLKARWEDIEKQSRSGSAPKLLYGEPDLTLKVVRDLFTEDFAKLVIQGEDAWSTVSEYVQSVAPDLAERLEKYDDGVDLFAAYRVDEQISKGLDRKVWLPSGGSLIIDRTEAMTVVDVNTGKFTGSGGNLEETVTKNNLEAAEEIVRQLRLRDIGGIIVVDFIDMVLESNRDLVLRRLVECLGRDRTRHQVAEVTSLGLVQMTRKRIGTGLLEAFSETCSHCQGRGLVVHDMPVEPKRGADSDGEPRRGNRRRRGRGNGGEGSNTADETTSVPSPAAVAAMAMSHPPAADEDDATPELPGTADLSDAAEEPTEAPETLAEVAGDETPAEDAAPAEPAKPVVVTRARRRSASRPAGSPIQGGEAQEIVVEAAPAVVPAEEQVSTPEPPKVVTRTRRGASRPAGAKAAAEPSEAEPSADVPTDAAGEDEAHVEHVPIKKKGTRKR
ncbi:MAG: Rne/Rng family ribonuclease [Nocardioidaceae bacterium]|nr:Rne/Rng family ribonuclease [Nocardioidaceae bacterium]